MTTSYQPTISELYNDQFELVMGYSSQENISDSLSIFINHFHHLTRDNQELFAKSIFVYDLFACLSTHHLKNDIISVINAIFDTIISEKGLRPTVRARYLINLSSFNPELAQTYISTYEDDLCSLMCKGADLALLKKYFAPRSAKINLHVSLLLLKEYKTNTLEENFKAIDFIYDVFDTLTAKVQRSMFTLIQTIIEHHLNELSQDDYFLHQDKLLSLLPTYPKLLTAYKGIHLSRLSDATGASPLVLQYALYPYMEMQTNQDSRGILITISGFGYKHRVEIAKEFLNNFNVPGRATFTDFLIDGFVFNHDNFDFLSNYLQTTNKITDIILILRLTNNNFLPFHDLPKYYQPLKIIEDIYHFPVKQRLDEIIAKNLTLANQELKDNKNVRGSYASSIISRQNGDRDYIADFNTLIQDIILHLISKEHRQALHTEAVLNNQTHPLNVSSYFFGALYDADSNTFTAPKRRSFQITHADLEKARLEVEANIQRLNEVLLNTALNMGYTPDEIDLLF